MLPRIRDHPTIAAVLGFTAIPAALLAAAAAIETLWSLASDDPLIPVVGKWSRDWADELLGMLAGLALLVLVALMVTVQFFILKAVQGGLAVGRTPDQASLLPSALHAGADLTIDLHDPNAATAQAVTFSAKQGHRVIVRRKHGEVDTKNARYRLPFKAEETKDLRDGYLWIQATIITGEGNRAVTAPQAVRTVSRLVR